MVLETLIESSAMLALTDTTGEMAQRGRCVDRGYTIPDRRQSDLPRAINTFT
jgi:hypothetical protein